MKPLRMALCVLLALVSLAAFAQDRLLQVLPLQGQQVVYDTVVHTPANAVELLARARKFMSDNHYDSVDFQDKGVGSEMNGSNYFYVNWSKSSLQSTGIKVFYSVDISAKDSAFMVRLYLNKVAYFEEDPPQEMSVMNFAVQRKSKKVLEDMNGFALKAIARCVAAMSH